MERIPLIVLARAEVAALLDMKACIEGVASAFRRLGEASDTPPQALGFPVRGGVFHVKASLLGGATPVFAAKVNANFPGNAGGNGLPTIQGVLILSDARDGRPLAVMDSGEITAVRTAAATAVAARHLARPDSRTVTVAGCGRQGAAQLRALCCVLPLAHAFAFDVDGDRADRLADALAPELGIEIEATTDLAAAARRSDAIVTCTTSHEALIGPGDVAPGAFVAAVGADHTDKCEIAPALMRAATVVVDDLDQCAGIGDLHHALAAGVMTRADVHADLAAVVAGRAPGRRTPDEITLFDSTGIAIEDAAAAVIVHARAVAEGRGRAIALAEAP